MKEKKLFMWYDSGNNEPYAGPHYYNDEKLIGKNLYYCLDDMLKMNISDYLKKRLKGAKIGTQIKIHYLHSSGDLMVKRITEEQAKFLDELWLLYGEISEHKSVIRTLESRCNVLKKKIMI